MRLAAILLICAGAVSAAPESSPRPVARVIVAEQVAALVVPASPLGAFRPVARPAAAKPLSPRPQLRPKGFAERAMARKRKRLKGSVCGDPEIQGTNVGAVPGRGACGISDAVRVREVAGVRLTQEALMNCDTADALKRWVTKSAKRELSSFGGGLAQLKVAAHYACRTRNNQPGARISEHGKGRAIDISAFIMRDGSKITVLQGWRAGKTSRAMKAMHKGACGPFGTVLGPNSDRFHQDHFHFDTARYRSGPYCR